MTQKVGVPVLPRPTKKPPKRFQALLDKFNKTSGEQLFVYWNPRSQPRVSSTVNLNGTYSVLGWEGRWELWRPVDSRMPVEVYEATSPCIIQGIGPAVKVWVFQENTRTITLQHPTGAQRVFQLGEGREPNEQDIERLRLCDMFRTNPHEVVRELIDKPNEAAKKDADRRIDDLAQDLTDYYWAKGSGIYAVGNLPRSMDRKTQN